MQCFENAIELDPFNVGAHVDLAQLCLSLGLLSRARSLCDKALELIRSVSLPAPFFPNLTLPTLPNGADGSRPCFLAGDTFKISSLTRRACFGVELSYFE